ncbi:MAG TPA: PEP/pyruvate-binding domain-containing protein [Candidatus Limnocylindrales bacterium]|nr:PEP/pyruvate-binding domain-containing protein [Candidatus Limnocylindrales bacterium]
MLVLPFEEIDRSRLPAVGGKAGNLGELTRAGLPVPQGFCVTTEAYRAIAESAGLDEIVEAVSQAAPTDVATLTSLAGRAREALLATTIPAEISSAILKGYQELGDDVRVAVRSSATAEDLPFASFAGQQDTFLNVVGEAGVIDATRRCWASLWTDRAVVYRATNAIDSHQVHLAVVVQRMVDSEVAGVMFTANPVTGRRHQAVIDAGPGLGEAVVSGAVNPDHFVVDTQDKRIAMRRLGDKRLAIRPLPGGGTSRVELPPGEATACLTDEQVLDLAALGERVEAYYGAPQDTEWAIDGSGAVWLTQARPITTLYPLPDKRSAGTRIYFSFSVAQGLYRPITPMGLAAFRVIACAAAELAGFKVADRSVGPPVFVPAGQRLYIDATTPVRSRVGRFVIPKILGVMEARSAAIMRHLFEDERFSMTVRSRLPFLRHVGPVALRYHVPFKILQALLRPDRARRKVERIGERLDIVLDAGPLGSGARRLDWVEKTLSTEVVPLLPRVVPVAGAGFVALGLADRLLGKDAAVGEVQAVLRGIPHNVTTEMDLELWRLAASLREVGPDQVEARYFAGTLPPEAQHGLVEFLARYGHRAVAEIDIGMPRWSDDPRHILGVLANYLRSDNTADTGADALFARGAAEAEAMVETLAQRTSQRSALRGRLVRGLLRRARALAGLRELPKFYLVRVIAAARAQLRAVGEELAAQGRIATAEDVFFLDLVEARAALAGQDMQSVVAQRRRSYEEELRRRHIPRVLLSDGTEPEVGLHSPGGEGLSGTPASAGVATGTARVILDPVGAHLEPGEILVAPSTDPGWTPLFLTAGGLVMEMGGANSHGAVVAREYGIPAVVGVPNATSVITSGSEIVVDGTAGSVAIM